MRLAVEAAIKASFNPRPRARGDFHKTQNKLVLSLFQSTPPREGRLSVIASK